MQPIELDHDVYGHYNETPHASGSLGIGEWDVVKQVLEYTLGSPIAWYYEGGTLHLWGENLDGPLLMDIVDDIEDLEAEYADGRFYDAAKDAERAASRLSRMDIQEPHEKVIT